MPPRSSLPDLSGRVCVITGATRGIGRATVDGLAALGARMVLLCRRRDEGDRIAEELAAAKRGPPADVIEVDLSSQRAIREAADTLRGRYPSIHVLINNAGVVPQQREVTSDGLEMQFAVNHLAYFMLTGLLLDRLTAAAPARVVNVTSGAHQGGTLDLADLQSQRRYDPVRVYGRTKLANVLFTYELARRIRSTGVTANCLHPGVIATRLLADYMNVPMVGGAVAQTFGGDPSEGADATVHLAASPELETVTGRYFVGWQESRSSPVSYDETLQHRLWEESARLASLAGALAP